MIETFAALLFAHVLADFVFQTNWIAENKLRPHVLLLHGVIVLVTAAAATGRIDVWQLGVLALVHIAIDWAKGSFAPEGLKGFVADQSAHLLSIAILAVFVPSLFAGGLWAGITFLPALMTLAAGAVLVTRAGGFAIGLLMQPWSHVELPKGLMNGGKLIGLLERGLIFLLVLVGQPVGIGFLIAAKSVLRFETTSNDQRAGEYVIIGTLASFGWALLFSYATVWLMAALPPLSVTDMSGSH
ncbi:MAG: DUF3307 domain-containing protein [Albidovulum sp.]|uniref:DUF3307 domain-containing protein n=1 Tax=Albidovulum sp. TaxID=1872424 RepID=UPI003C8B64DA